MRFLRAPTDRDVLVPGTTSPADGGADRRHGRRLALRPRRCALSLQPFGSGRGLPSPSIAT
jgi:hypothetical protein